MNAVAETVETPAKPTRTREVDKVQLTDGRTVEFVGKRKMLKESKIPGEDGYDGPLAVQFDFKNGNTVLFAVPEALMNHFAAHGAAQKIGDETAGEDDVDDMQLAVESIIERLSNGQWSKEREGGGFGGTSVLIQALQLAWPAKTLEDIRAWLKPKTKAEKDALRASSRLKPIVDKLEAEKAAKTAHIDTDALFNDLDAA